jgi:hypothetical protein
MNSANQSLDNTSLGNTLQPSIELPVRRGNINDNDDSVLHGTLTKQQRSAPASKSVDQQSLNESASTTSVNKPITEPVRTEPQNVYEPRKRKLDRQVEERVPEIHIIGNVVSGKDIIIDSTEGAMCRCVFFRGCSIPLTYFSGPYIQVEARIW